MKKYIFLFLFIFLITNTVIAQIQSVRTNMYGDYELVIDLNDQGYVVVDAYGQVLEIRVKGRVEYYSDFNDYEAGKIRRIGNISFSYYSGFNDYETGKIKQIGTNRYIYYSGHESRKSPGALKSGERSFESGGIHFRFRR